MIFVTLLHYLNVASFTDAWIETPQQGVAPLVGLVASFTDAWIETNTKRPHYHLLLSHLLQMRGLKLKLPSVVLCRLAGRIFYRCVD